MLPIAADMVQSLYLGLYALTGPLIGAIEFQPWCQCSLSVTSWSSYEY